MSKSKFSSLLAIAVCILFITSTAFAQFNASLSGTVQDSTGAVVANATVTLLNLGTNQTQTVTTSGTGFYQFGQLSPAHYKLTATAAGFKAYSLNDISLAAETARGLNVSLTPGEATATVNVSADQAPILQTAGANIQTTIDSEAIAKLPTYGADPYELLRTAPGITGDGSRQANGNANYLPNAAGPGGSNSGIFQTENQIQIAANGQRTADNNITIDGVSVNSLTHGGAAVVSPNVEAVGQITVVSTSYDASDGRNSGAQIKVVTKSGTNSLHGSAFMLYDEPGLNAYNRWNGPTPGTKTVRVDNKTRNWAASLGGPIIKDKLFLFTSYAGFKTSSNGYSTGYVETSQYRAAVAAQRAGGISARILADPGSLPRIISVLTPNCSGFGTGTCAVVTGGLDIGSLTPGGTSQLGVFPANTAIGNGLDGVPDVQNVQLTVPSHSRGNQFNGRVDWNLTSRDLLAASFYLTKLSSYGTSGAAGSRPQADVPFKPLNTAGTIIFIHTFSPTWLNELRANATRFYDNGLTDAPNVNYGIPYVNVQTLPFPIQYGANQASTTPSIFAENTYEISEVLTHTWGSHILHIGGNVRLEQDNDNLLGNERPVYAMQGLWTFANDAPIYEAITANPNTGGPPLAQRYFRSQNYGVFIQHDWKVTPSLSFNSGLRWELFTPLHNKGFEINYPVLGSGPNNQLSGMTLTPHDKLWDTQYSNFSPKIGFAYNPAYFGNNIVIRGGFAIAYNHLDTALFNNALEDGPGIANYGLCCASNGNSAGIQYAIGTSNSPTSFPFNPALATGVNASGFPNPYGGGTTTYEVYGALTNLKTPMSYLYSLETQYQLPYKLTATIGYGGSTGHHYARLVNQNFLYNNTNAVTYAAYFAQTDSNQSYNSLNLQLQRQMSKGFTFTAFYTWSKSLDQVTNGDGANSNANQTNPAVNSTEWGPSDNDVRHRITATALYELPHFRTQHAAVNALVNGWQVNGIMTYHTGFPWTPVTYNLQANPIQNAGVVGPTRPIAYYGHAGNSCDTKAYQTGSNFPGGGNLYFNSTTPTVPPGQTYRYVPGIGRNSWNGACYFNADLSAAKEFAFDAVNHHMLFRFQANFYNAFNKLQLSPITNGNANAGANIQNQYFGYAQSADAGRQIEFQARLQF
jgi:hypothetical protein